MKQYIPSVSYRCSHTRWWLKREKNVYYHCYDPLKTFRFYSDFIYFSFLDDDGPCNHGHMIKYNNKNNIYWTWSNGKTIKITFIAASIFLIKMNCYCSKLQYNNTIHDKKIACLSSSVVIDVNNHNVNNYDNVRKRKFSPSNVSSKSTSVFSSTSSIPYYKRIVINNKLSNQEHIKPIDNSNCHTVVMAKKTIKIV